jgi:hypothetical protein
MEFLQGLGTGGNNPEGNSSGAESEAPAQGNSPTPSQSQSQAQTEQQGNPTAPSGAIDGNPSQTARDTGPNSTAGTSQNAMEFLMGNTSQTAETTDDAGGTSENMNSASESASNASDDTELADQQFTQQDSQSDGQDSGSNNEESANQGDSQENGQTSDDQQTESPQESVSSTPSENTSPVSDVEPEEESTAGASQNALEYLMEESTQVDDDINSQADTNQSGGTLTIQELLNARGVNNTSVTLPSSSAIDEEQPLEETKPDKDGDG